jgi:hypothetical protein
MKISIIPKTLQQEPTNWIEYDSWQTREGLLDGSDALRDAWKAFRPTWTADRDARRTRNTKHVDVPYKVLWWLPKAEQRAAVEVRAWVRGNGEDRGQWDAWRAWCRKNDYYAYCMVRNLVTGTGVGLIAATYDLDQDAARLRIRCVLEKWATFAFRVKNQRVTTPPRH